jgi:hypothetical protein
LAHPPARANLAEKRLDEPLAFIPRQPNASRLSSKTPKRRKSLLCLFKSLRELPFLLTFFDFPSF